MTEQVAIQVFLLFFGVISMGLVGVLIFHYLRKHAPEILFDQHVHAVIRGKYRNDRTDDGFTIKAKGVEVVVEDARFRNHHIQFKVRSGAHSFFRFYYNKASEKLESFNFEKNFAKHLNHEQLLQHLEMYVAYLLEKEYGLKSERIQANEKMNVLGAIFQSKEAVKEYDGLPFEKTHSAELNKLIAHIQPIAMRLQQKKQLLAIEVQHDLDNLIEKRLPNLLKHADNYESGIKNVLQEVLYKLDEWEQSIENRTMNQFEKECVLIKEIIER